MPPPIESRTFHPYYVSSRSTRFILKVMLPVLILVTVVFAVWFLLHLPDLLPPDATAEVRVVAIPLMVALGIIVGTMPLPLLALWYFVDRDFFRHTIVVDFEGVTQRKGTRTRHIPWGDVERMTTFRLGRVQLATLHSARAKIRFDASMVDRDGPQPRRTIDMKREYLQYPDGSIRSLSILDNELYQLIAERAPAESADAR